MSWEVEIVGDAFDLKMLSESFIDSDLRVLKVGTEFRLEWSSLQGLDNEDTVLAQATERLQILTGAARLSLGLREPLRVAGVAQRLPGGGRRVFAHAVSNISVRGVMTTTLGALRGDGTIEVRRPADAMVGWLKVAATDERARAVLRQLSADVLDWVSMYRLLEIVEEDVGGNPQIVQRGWASAKSIQRFKHTADSRSAVGDASRHGRERTAPPVNPMDLGTARSMIRNIATSWLNEKAQQLIAP